MINQPDSPQEPRPLSGKLILPAPPDEENYQRMSRPLPAYPVRPEQLIQRSTPPLPPSPLAKLRFFWGKDPAYKVLILAIGTVLIAGLLVLSLASTALLRNISFFASGNSLSQTPPTAVVPTGTVDVKPTFPPPAGGKGSGTSSQPPAQSTPVLQPTASTPTTQPTPGGQLTVQISNIPGRVQNNSAVAVTVTTSEPDASVVLYVFYNAPPYRYTSGMHHTDGNGNATFYWMVNVYMFGRHTQATVYAVATDSNGQRAVAQSVTVQIFGSGGG